MRVIVLCLGLLIATAAAAAPSVAPPQGRWVCLPDDSSAPQVLVDFEENIYRRCDQNTCSEYDILAVTRQGETTEVTFAPGAAMRAADGGGRYTETLAVGSTATTSSGSCTFRAASEP